MIARRHVEVRETAPEESSELRELRKTRGVKPEAEPNVKRKVEREVLYVWIKGHRYRCLDKDAGARTYTRPSGKSTSWIGGLDMVMVDQFTGGTLIEMPLRADDREHHGYPALLRKLEQTTGCWPETVAGDAGISTKAVFRLNTRRLIGSVIDWRKPNRAIATRQEMRTDAYDEHGIPRCKHCGGPGALSAARCGAFRDHGEPVLRYRCRTGATPECITTLQQIQCREEWRLLNPI